MVGWDGSIAGGPTLAKLSPMPRPAVSRTRRLVLRRLTTSDAGLVLELFNDPAFLRDVGDRGIRRLGDAERYLVEGPIRAYESLGFGLWRVELAKSGEPIGVCGLLQRDYLPAPDLGFAVLARFRSAGYASEAAAAALAHAREGLGIERVLAITSSGNKASQKILRRIGLRPEGVVRDPADGSELRLFATVT